MDYFKLKSANIFFLIIVIIAAIPFYLYAIDGPYVKDKKLDQICPALIQDRASYWIQKNKCYRHSIIDFINKGMQIFGISQFIYKMEILLFVMFLPLVALYSNFSHYVHSRIRKTRLSFIEIYKKAAMCLIIAGFIGVLPSIFLREFGCSGEWCVPTYLLIIIFLGISMVFGLLSSAICRFFMKKQSL